MGQQISKLCDIATEIKCKGDSQHLGPASGLWKAWRDENQDTEFEYQTGPRSLDPKQYAVTRRSTNKEVIMVRKKQWIVQ